MADENDYTRMWDGTFQTPTDSGGVYVLDAEYSVARAPAAYDSCTRELAAAGAHPRRLPCGLRYPGPYGGGRASDAVGPGPAYGWRRGLAGGRERFSFDAGPSDADRALYARGSRRLGRPGRTARNAIDAFDPVERPPHFASDSSNAHAHLSIVPDTRGAPAPTAPQQARVEKFTPWPTPSPYETAQLVLLVVLAVLVALRCLQTFVAEKRVAYVYVDPRLGGLPGAPPLLAQQT
jgi:hypothetical protein